MDAINSFYETPQEVVRNVFNSISQYQTVTLIRKTGIDNPNQYLISTVPKFAQHCNVYDNERLVCYDDVTTMFKDVLRHLENLGDITAMLVNPVNINQYIVKYKEPMPPRPVHQILGEFPLWRCEETIAQMQKYYRVQYMVKNEMCLYFDCSYWETMTLLNETGLSVPSQFRNLDEWMKDISYPGRRILKALEYDIDMIDGDY